MRCLLPFHSFYHPAVNASLTPSSVPNSLIHTISQVRAGVYASCRTLRGWDRYRFRVPWFGMGLCLLPWWFFVGRLQAGWGGARSEQVRDRYSSGPKRTAYARPNA